MERQLRPRKKLDIASDSATVKKVKKVTPESNAAKAKKTTTPVKKVTKNQDKTPTRKLNTNNVLTRKNLRGKGSPKAATDSGNQSIKKFMTAKREDVNKQMEARRSLQRKKNELERVFSFEDTEEDKEKTQKTKKKVVKKKPNKEVDKYVLTMAQVRDLYHTNNNVEKDANPRPRKFFKTPMEDMNIVVRKEVLWSCNKNGKPKKSAFKPSKIPRARNKAPVKKLKVTKTKDEKVDEAADSGIRFEEVKLAPKQVNLHENNNKTEDDPVDEVVSTTQDSVPEAATEDAKITFHPEPKTAFLNANPFRKTIFSKPLAPLNQNSVKSRTRTPLGENNTIQNTTTPMNVDQSWEAKSPDIKFTQMNSIVMSTPHVPNFQSDVISKVNQDLRAGRPPLLAVQKENKIQPPKDAKRSTLKQVNFNKNDNENGDENNSDKTKGKGVHVVSDEILTENNKMILLPRKTTTLSKNPFRKTIFPKRTAQISPKCLKENVNSNENAENLFEPQSPDGKFAQRKSIVMSTPYVQNFTSDVISKINNDLRSGRTPFVETEVENQLSKDNKRDKKVQQSHRKHSGEDMVYKENIEPSMTNTITVEAVIEPPPRSKEETAKITQRPPLLALNGQMNCKENIEPSMMNKITVEAVIEAPPRSKEEAKVTQRTPLKSLDNSNIQMNRNPPNFALSNEVLDEISAADVATNALRPKVVTGKINRNPPNVALSNEVLDEISVAEVAADAPRPKVKDKIRASLFSVDNAFGFDFSQDEPVKKPGHKMRQPKLLEVATNVGYLNNLKHTHSPTVRYLVKEIENIITTKPAKSAKTEDSESQMDDSTSCNESVDQNSTRVSAKDWSNTFDIDSFEQESEDKDQDLLFKDIPEPAHFKEPVKFSYSRKRKISFAEEESEDEEVETKKKTRSKKKKDKKAPKASREETEWVKNMNKTFEEIEDFDLCVE